MCTGLMIWLTVKNDKEHDSDVLCATVIVDLAIICAIAFAIHRIFPAV
jgi:hypothetical protein